MSKQESHPCNGLFQQWQVKRELANYYFTALLRLSPDAHDAPQRRQELNEKVFDALLSWKHVDDQLQSCYQDMARKLHDGEPFRIDVHQHILPPDYVSTLDKLGITSSGGGHSQNGIFKVHLH